MSKRVVSLLKYIFRRIFDFGKLSPRELCTILFVGGLFFVLDDACSYGRSLYLTHFIEQEISPRIYVSTGNEVLAVIGGCVYFLAAGSLWRVICEIIYFLYENMVRIWGEKRR